MAHPSILLFVVLAVVLFLKVSANNVIYSVTFVSCVQGSTCPQGNPLTFNRTFALNGSLSPNLTLNVGDRLEFDLATNVSIHPLTICQNSPVPSFCQGATNSDLLNTPITQAGTNTSVNFTTAGTYYYGCLNHPGMGAKITVVQAATSTSTSSTASSTSSTATSTSSTTSSTSSTASSTSSTTSSTSSTASSTSSTTTSTSSTTSSKSSTASSTSSTATSTSSTTSSTSSTASSTSSTTTSTSSTTSSKSSTASSTSSTATSTSSTTTSTSSTGTNSWSTSTKRISAGNQLSKPFLLIPIVSLLAIIFI